MLKLMMQGQTSQVWEATELSSGRHFAIKLLLPENTRSPEHRQFLFHEAEVGLKLHHKNVMRVMHLIRSKDNPYMVMEYFPGGNLEVRLQLKQDLIKENAHWIIEQAATGLAFMHAKGWVHRDVKPANILCNSSAEVKIIDFALAKRITRRRGFFSKIFKRRGQKTMGTRSYMSPEQIVNDYLDERADIYSFGATCYELISGRPPFRGLTPGDLLNKHLRDVPVTPQSHNPNVTDECAKLILRMLAKKRDDRPRDFNEFLGAFRTTRVFKGDKLERRKEKYS
jgi:eukaryotic-like serine/threonine-protein kinase